MRSGKTTTARRLRSESRLNWVQIVQPFKTFKSFRPFKTF
jgi:hypothetical protein